jgi:elongation factor Tu
MELLDAIDKSVPEPVRELDKPFLLPIEAVHSIPGRGTVVTGRVERGIMKKGVDCDIIGYGKSAKSTVTGLEMFHQILEEGRAGDQLGALVRGIKRDDIRHGMVLAKPGTVAMKDDVEAQVYILSKEEGGRARPFTSMVQMMMFSRTWDCPCFVVIPGKDMVMPGEDAKVQLKLIKPMVLEQGTRFTLREGKTTLGTGVITKINANMTPHDRELLMENRKRREKIEQGLVQKR